MTDKNEIEAIEALDRIYSRAHCLSAQEDKHNDNDQMIVSMRIAELEKELAQVQAENEKLERIFDFNMNQYELVGKIKDAKISHLENENEKLKALVRVAMPYMEYIHSKLPNGSEALLKYKQWSEKAKEFAG